MCTKQARVEEKGCMAEMPSQKPSWAQVIQEKGSRSKADTKAESECPVEEVDWKEVARKPRPLKDAGAGPDASSNANRTPAHPTTYRSGSATNYFILKLQDISDLRWFKDYVIGENGQHVRSIREKTGVRLEIRESDSHDGLKVCVLGSDENLGKVKRTLEKVAQAARDVWAEAKVPYYLRAGRHSDLARFQGDIIGEQGAHTKHIRQETGVNCWFCEAEDKPDCLKVQLRCCGRNPNVRGAKEMLEKYALQARDWQAPEILQANAASEVNRFRARVIGKEGVNLKAILQETGVGFDLKQAGSDRSDCLEAHPRRKRRDADLQKARTMLQNLVGRIGEELKQQARSADKKKQSRCNQSLEVSDISSDKATTALECDRSEISIVTDAGHRAAGSHHGDNKLQMLDEVDSEASDEDLPEKSDGEANDELSTAASSIHVANSQRKSVPVSNPQRGLPARRPREGLLKGNMKNIEGGYDMTRVQWRVNVERLSGNCNTVKSPQFDLSFREGSPELGPFTLMLSSHPASSFDNSCGQGLVLLWCEAGLLDVPRVSVQFSVSQLDSRAPVEHDFSQREVCKLLGDAEVWDFQRAVDSYTDSFEVSLDITPLDARQEMVDSFCVGSVDVPVTYDHQKGPAKTRKASHRSESYEAQTKSSAQASNQVVDDGLCGAAPKKQQASQAHQQTCWGSDPVGACSVSQDRSFGPSLEDACNSSQSKRRTAPNSLNSIPTAAMQSQAGKQNSKVKDEDDNLEPADENWPYEPESQPSVEVLRKWKTLRSKHGQTHTVEDVLESMQNIYSFMQDLDKQGIILGRNAMHIFLEHCCAKSASFEVESLSFNAANLALKMMEEHNCKFDMDIVTKIAMQINLRADPQNILCFVQNLVKKTLTQFSADEQMVFANHMAFAIAERKQTFDESIEYIIKSEAFNETGLKVDWSRSTNQQFHLCNTKEGHFEHKNGKNGDGFRKGDYALLTTEGYFSNNDYLNRHLNWAIVEITKSDDEKPLQVRLRAHPRFSLKPNASFRLDRIDVAEVPTQKTMKALQVLSGASKFASLKPDPRLLERLLQPAEREYSVLIPKRANEPLTDLFKFSEDDDAKPVRVKTVDKGAFLNWNRSNPDTLIQVGDRVARVNGICEKDKISKQLQNSFSQQTYEIVLARKVLKQEGEVLMDSTFVSKAKEKLLEAEPSLKKNLNTSQHDAVRSAALQRVCLIQGPPGTGKTTTALELLDFLLDSKIVPTPILVTAHTNTAVDNLLLGLIKRGRNRVVRVGSATNEKVHPECLPYVVGEEMATDLKSADLEVVCATCIGSGSNQLEKAGLEFHTVLIDECTQATETSCLVPICHGAKQLVLIGDQCQLEPLVKCSRAGSDDLEGPLMRRIRHEGLGTSLFNRFHQQGFRPVMLDTQYRMHSSICDFPSHAFYNGALKSGARDEDRLPTPSDFKWPSKDLPVCFIDAVDGQENDSDGAKSNECEASIVALALKKLMKDTSGEQMGAKSVGVVTPYAGQKKLIIGKLEKEGFVDDKGICSIGTNTVDGFQGQEREIIIFSAVRSNKSSSVGFLDDWRRVNVMLTRAKRGLIIIGNKDTLRTNRIWSSWLGWAARKGCICTCDKDMKLSSFAKAKDEEWIPRCLIEDDWTMDDSTSDDPASSKSTAAPKTPSKQQKQRSSLEDEDKKAPTKSSKRRQPKKTTSPEDDDDWGHLHHEDKHAMKYYGC
mmetsp:Transcript_115056/g.199628  ORF Transcript_115056/g.199628 Transcript_115056/m.199628 type:complete len:1706 (-) Transcript_115056:102-5219(-)